MPYCIRNGELFHYGVLGMRWGVRRYQNIDGSLTEAGKDHRAKYVAKEQKRLMKQYARYEKRNKGVLMCITFTTEKYIQKTS